MKLNIETGIKKRAIKCVIMGCEGIGKSTLASKFPKPLFLDTENGTASLDVRRIMCNKSWDELIEVINKIIKEPSICETLVIDTADWAEQLAEEAVCEKNRVTSIESIPYGKGYKYVAECFNTLLKLLDKCIELGIHVVFTAHAKPRKYELPEEQGQFDRWEMKLTKQVSPLLKEWCDMLLFCNYKTFVITTENNTKKASGGKRVMYTTHNPCWDAKNRFSLADELDLAFSSISHLFADVSPKTGQPEPTKETIRPTLEKFKTMIKEAGITEEDIKVIVANKGHYALDADISTYSDDFITRWIIPNWTKIVQTITKNNGGM
jgi:nicotinamidase-related amidase